MATTKTPSSERDDRYARIRERMQASGLDALLVGCKGHWWTGRGYARYLSDFHLWGHDGLILLPAEGEPALVVTSPAVAGLVARRGWITDTDGDVYLVPRVRRAIRERGLEGGRIGTVGTPWIISADLYRELVDDLPHARVEPADEIVDGVRMVKSSIEIQQNREVWELAKTSMERFAAVLTPGRPASSSPPRRARSRSPAEPGTSSSSSATAAIATGRRTRSRSGATTSCGTTWRSPGRAVTGAS
jgi:Xaa-Pro aminopeptidase